MEPNSAAELRRWFNVQRKFELSAIAQDTIDADTTIVSCPFSLAIDVECALYALTALFGESSLVNLPSSWSERQLISTHTCLQWIFPDSSPIPDVLRHLPYWESLPPADALLTSIQFTPSALKAFRDTNIYGATHDRQESWSAEWNKCRTFIHTISADWAERYTCYPLMIPGMDIPVSWCTSYPEGSMEARDDSTIISIISHTTTPLGEEVFTNYGLKANDKLILGYDFSLPQHPDDKITLHRWNEVRRLVAETPDEIGYEDDLEAAQLLLEMVHKKCDLLPDLPDENDAGTRPAVELMIKHYLEGQRDILTSLKLHFKERQEATVEATRDEGIKLVFDDDSI
ncbi:hypothetical protein F4604DRAFT_1714194 [Suillus subluteus]|nr:hypothetical protein F4604DRAFT_1714194 [Suillus subluteus]